MFDIIHNVLDGEYYDNQNYLEYSFSRDESTKFYILCTYRGSKRESARLSSENSKQLKLKL